MQYFAGKGFPATRANDFFNNPRDMGLSPGAELFNVMKRNKRLYLREELVNVFSGVILGLLFVFLSFIVQAHSPKYTLSWESFILIHQQELLMWLIDLSPLALGLYGWIVGRQKRDISKYSSRYSSLNEEYNEIRRLQQRSEREKEVYLNSVTELVTFHDKDLKIVWANSATLEYSGLSSEQLIGNHCHTVWGGKNKPCQDCPAIKSLKTGETHESEHISPDGKHWLLKAFPVFDEANEIIGTVEVAKDITSEALYKHKAKLTEEKYRNVVERATDGIIIVQDLVIKYTNPRLRQMLGYDESEILGKPFLKFVGQNEHEKLKENYLNRMAGKPVPAVYESQTLHKNGSVINVEISGGLIIYESKPADLIFVRDITERKQAQDALLEAEERYRDLVESINEVIYALDKDGVIDYISPAIKYIAEYRPAEMIDKNISEYIYKDDIDIFNNNINKVLDGKPAIFECRLVTKYSAVCWLRISAKPGYTNNNITGIQGLMIEITDQRAAEKALAESEKRYRSITEVTSDYAYLFKVDDDGVFRLDWIAGAIYSISGYLPEEVIANGGFAETMVHPDDVDQVKKHSQKLLANKEDIYDLRIITKNGEIRYLRHMGRPIWDANKGRVVEIVGAGQDLTERILAEKAMLESEERLSLALEAANEGLWDWDFEQSTTYFSPRYYTMLGYFPYEFPPHKDSWINLMHPDDRDRVIRKMDEAIKIGSKSFIVEFRMKAKDGSWRTILSRGQTVGLYSDGTAKRFVGTHTDITEVKQAEQALKENEEMFRTITSTANDAIVMMNQDGLISFWNEMAEKIFGYTRDEILGKELHGLLAPLEYHHSHRKAFAFFRKSGQGDVVGKTLELEALRKDGGRFSVELSLSALQLKNQWHAVGIIRDITERKRAEAEIRNSRQMLQAVLDNIPQRIYWKDRHGVYLGCNKQFARDAGTSSTNEIIGKTDFDMPWRSSDAEAFRKDDSYVIENNKAKYNVIEKQTRPDGSIAWLDTNRVPLHDSKGGVVGLLGTYEDITERKLTEQKNKQLQEKLEKAKRMESLGLLAGGIAHDLNNTLSPLVGYSDMILGELKSDDPMHKRIWHIYRASQDAADVIQDLLTMARRGRYEMSPVNLTEVIIRYLESPGFISKQQSNPIVNVISQLDPDIPGINGSVPHLSKAVMNLIVNAFDAMPNGGQLVVETSKVYLESLLGGHSEVEKGDYIVLRVSDTGVGIPPDDLKKIFEPYYSKKKLGSSGSGLGLAVVYGIVKDHKGYYDVISTLGEGTTFILYFPVTSEKSLKTEGVKLDPSGSESILVVEDSPEQRMLTSELLKSYGYKVETVENGHKAIEYLSQYQTDLVILDMIMEKGYDGLDTYRDILKINPQQKALIVSGFSASERVNEMLEMGAGAFLKKPFTRNKIGTAVRQVLGSQSSQKENVSV